MWKLIVALLVLTSGGLYAAIVKTDQTHARELVKEKAQTIFLKGDWPASEVTYREILKTEPENAEAWFRLSLAVHYQGRFEESIAGFQRAQGYGYKSALCTYNMACGYARLNQPEPALKYLKIALQEGMFGAEQVRSDADFKALHGDKRFESIVDELGKDKDTGVIIIRPDNR